MIKMNEEFRRAIIIENYHNPKNKGLISDNSYKKINANSKTCIDQIDIQLKLKDNIVEDVRFDGEACAICTSSMSILIKTIIGKTKEEALAIINNFENMIEEEDYDPNKLGEAIVYSNISKQPNRKKCALLGWQGTQKILNEYEK